MFLLYKGLERKTTYTGSWKLWFMELVGKGPSPVVCQSRQRNHQTPNAPAWGAVVH